MRSTSNSAVDGLEAAAGTATAAASIASPRIRTVRAAVDARLASSPASQRLRRLRAVVLLHGTVCRSPFAEAIDRSVLELPVTAGQIILDLWRDHVALLSGALQLDGLRCRIMVAQTTRPPIVRPQDQQAGITMETDPSDLRGTGGVLRDLAEAYDEDDTLLVANAAQLLVEPLHQLALEAASRGGEVTVVANGDGTPTSMALLSCRALRQLAPVGFVDFKEQGLPLIAKHHEVTILRRAAAYALPIRTAADYLAALRAHHRIEAGEVPEGRPFDERWQRRFGMVEEGAAVAQDAILHDAVVLRGASVGPGALVAESIVCGGGVVRAKENVLRQVIGRASRVSVETERQ